MKRIITAILLAALVLAACVACGGKAPEAEETAAPGPVFLTVWVTTPDGIEKPHQLTTEKPTLGEALREAGLIECDESGFVSTVNGVKADYNVDKAYWAFYIDGVYASYGVDDEIIAEGKRYELKYTEG